MVAHAAKVSQPRVSCLENRLPQDSIGRNWADPGITSNLPNYSSIVEVVVQRIKPSRKTSRQELILFDSFKHAAALKYSNSLCDSCSRFTNELLHSPEPARIQQNVVFEARIVIAVHEA